MSVAKQPNLLAGLRPETIATRRHACASMTGPPGTPPAVSGAAYSRGPVPSPFAGPSGPPCTRSNKTASFAAPRLS